MQRLLTVEHDAATELVNHVNKLKEGWDATNLYTIVPLRASASEILTEQTIGRGLRLPYGKRTGVEAVDRLTIVAHDRFQEIIDRANEPDSIIRKRVEIGAGGDVPPQRPQTVEAPSIAETALTGRGTTIDKIARELGLSAKTISTYRSRVLNKMKMKTNAELIHYAIRNGLLDGPVDDV